MAQAMGCKMVYGIVPMGGKTLEALAEHRLWVSVLGVGLNQCQRIVSLPYLKRVGNPQRSDVVGRRL